MNTIMATLSLNCDCRLPSGSGGERVAKFYAIGSVVCATFLQTVALAQTDDEHSRPKVNRTIAAHAVPAEATTLAENAAEADIRTVRLFSEPLVPLGKKPTAEENKHVATALRSHVKRVLQDDYSGLEQFVSDHQDSPWRGSILCNLGQEYYKSGWYSKALAAWERAWSQLKNESDPRAKPLADRAAGELALMYARLGRMSDLETLLNSVQKRVFVGAATEKIAGARQGLWTMQNRPEIAFRCGPMALDRILARQDPKKAGCMIVQNSKSSTNGFSLEQVTELSKQLEMNFQMAFRDKGAQFILPSVVHWKLGHYASLLREENGLYLVQDPTFNNDAWVSRRALEAETSGYYLVPSGELPKGWRKVSKEEGARVWGKGQTDSNDPNNTTPHDKKKDDCNSDDKDCEEGGMARHNVHLLDVSLNIQDKPVGYKPPLGPAVYFLATYNHREAGQPAIFTYSNLGPKWTFNWLAFISDDPATLSGDVGYYTDGGGTEPFTGFSSSSQTFAPQLQSHTLLKRTSLASYEMLYPNGARKIFNLTDAPTNATSRRVFLTQIIDPRGNAVQISYDQSFRVVAVTDAIGQVTTFSYDLEWDDLKITKVTDPFGRFAKLDYDAYGRLSQITDSVGLVSQFGYNSGDFIQSLTTPYGTTTFVAADVGRGRWLEITHPNGEKERVEFSESANVGVPDYEPAALVPRGMNTLNQYLEFRNTYVWDRRAYPAYAINTNDYTKAHIYHWLHEPGLTTASGVLESEKLALENRVWYNYGGQFSPNLIGDSDRPTIIGRVLDDGSTQLKQFAYNVLGRLTNSVDAIGRSTTYLYSTNQVDLLEVRQTTGKQNELLSRLLYDNRHSPVQVWDAAGQTTTNTYNERGQRLSSTNAKGETTRFTYDTNGFLTTIIGPANNTNSFTYDAVGRTQTHTGVDGFTITYNYDDLDRQVRVSYPDGTFTEFTYDRLDRVKVRDRSGSYTAFTFDVLRHLTSMEDSLHHVTRFEYCGCGDLSGLIDSGGHKTTWDYDVEGRLINKHYADGSYLTFSYEETLGRLKSICNERGEIKEYAYYVDDNLKQIIYPNAAITTPSVTFSYDTSYDRMISMQDAEGATMWTYYPPGSLGALSKATQQGPWSNAIVTYRYDELGRTVCRSINGNDLCYTYDAIGRVTNVLNDLGKFVYAYDGGTTRRAYVSYPNGQSIQFDYQGDTGDHRLRQITNLNPYHSPISQFAYDSNPLGNVTNWTEIFGTNHNSWRLTYDDLDQLTAATVSPTGTESRTYSYEYDSVGNRVSETDNGYQSRFGYNSLNQLVYDSDTNLNLVKYEWDAEGRLASVTINSNKSEFIYDGLGRRVRIRESTNGVTWANNTFLWCDDEICEGRDSQGTRVLKRFFSEGFSLVGDVNRTNYFYSKDHLGSIRDVSDNSGNVVAHFDYDPYGRPSSSGQIATDFAFAGYFHHVPSGLYLTLYRAYSPDLGRWLSRDPISEWGGINLYAYADNSPITKWDPLGLECTYHDTACCAHDFDCCYNSCRELKYNEIVQQLKVWQELLGKLKCISSGKPWSCYKNATPSRDAQEVLNSILNDALMDAYIQCKAHCMGIL